MTAAASSFSDRLIAGKGHLIRRYDAVDKTGRQAVYYILMEPPQAARFARALADLKEQRGIIDFAQYGKVIASCYGTEPSAQVRALLKERYGFDV